MKNVVIYVIIVFVLATMTNVYADESRGGKAEVFGSYMYMGSESTNTKIFGAKLDVDVDNTSMYGLGIGYNVNDHININMDFMGGNADAEVKYKGLSDSINTSLTFVDLNVDYNILKGRFTPLITGGVGYVRMRDDLNESDFSYNLGLGLRYDMETMFFKTVYRSYWLHMDDVDDFNLDTFTLMVGIKF